MKIKDLFALMQGLQAVSNLQGSKFVYAVAKNMRIVKREIEDVLKTIEPNEDFQKYEQKRIRLCEEFCEFEQNGKPIIKEDNYTFNKENKVKFDKKLAELGKEFKTTIEARQKQLDGYKLLVEEEEYDTAKLHTLKEEDLPEGITAQQILGIDSLIIWKDNK